MSKPRYVFIGGFLGAGKTTAMIKFAEHLAARGERVGVITNDQSTDLVDTERVRAAGFPVDEITGGCFCCKFDALVSASERLCAAAAPEVVLAEPVGSCTDIRATVGLPLHRLHSASYDLAPLSVMVDPERCAQEFGLVKEAPFSGKVLYVFRKQLEEADFIVINKVDRIDARLRERLIAETQRRFPAARVFAVSCRTGDGLDAWFAAMRGETSRNRATMDVDYDLYAEGEARLGWLNATARIDAPAPFDGDAAIAWIAEHVRRTLAARHIEIAHLKLTMRPDGVATLGAVSLTSTNEEPVPTRSLGAHINGGNLLVNLRAEAAPELLRAAVARALAELPDARTDVGAMSAFRPGRPTPTYRMTATAG
ncbi:MAG: GTP-binding protein [Phycisphaerales bacterium]